MDRRLTRLLILTVSLLPGRLLFSQETPTSTPAPEATALPQPPGPRPPEPRHFDDGEHRPPKPPDGDRDRDRDRDRKRDGNREMPEELRKRVEQMSPEERERFERNYEKWKKLPPEQRDLLRKTKDGKDRREFFKKAVEEALEKTGLHLSQQDREAFAWRYMEERRKIEEQLRREMDQKRNELMPAVLEQLKKEFSSRNQPEPVAPAPSPTPSASTGGSGA